MTSDAMITDEMVERAMITFVNHESADPHVAMRTALTAALAKAWRPIESARLGDVIDVMCQDADFKTWVRFCDVKLTDDRAPYAFEFYEGARIVSFKPHENGMVLTHWMPRPAPPQQEGE